jgi:hypothetical protein
VHEKEIIICFNSNVSHGGLVDRLKGIISFYEISRKLDYDFKMYFNDQFVLSEFLEPNKYNWEIDRLKFNPLNTKVLYFFDSSSVNDYLEYFKRLKKKRIIVFSNLDILPVLYGKELGREVWRKNYKELFKPSEKIKTHLKKYSGKKIISFHTRFTSIMGDFKDVNKKELLQEEKENLMRDLVNEINSIVKKTVKDEVVYVLSDSITFLKYIKNNTNYKILDGNPKHIDFYKNNEVILKTFIDFYFLIESEKIFILFFKNMYNSKFSRYAAIIGNKPYEIIRGS